MRKPKVVSSIHNETADRCVDILAHSDGRYSYKEFRRDPEDQGVWYAIGAESPTYACEEAAVASARKATPWMPGDGLQNVPRHRD